MLGKKIRELRQKAGLSQAIVAKETGLSPSYICRIERGKRHTPVWVLAALERALSLEPGTLDVDYEKRRAYANQLYEGRISPSLRSTVDTSKDGGVSPSPVPEKDQGA